MTNKLTLFLALVLGLGATAAHAQADFRPGYVVLPSGDTLRGEVDYRGIRRNSQLCQFRLLTAGANVQVLRPNALRGFGYAGSLVYRSRLTPQADSAERPRPARLFFLQVLVDGLATLYTRRDNNNGETRYYLQGTASAVQELAYRREEVITVTQRYYRDVNTYRGTLATAFADCPAVLPAVAATPFKESALVAVVQRYNNCRQPSSVAVRPVRKKGQLSLGVLAGMQTSQLVFRGDINQTAGNFRGRPAPELGLSLHFISPMLSEKLMLRVEALYASQSYEDEYVYSSLFTPLTSYQVRTETSYLRVPLLLRYTLPKGKVRPFVEIGYVMSPALRVSIEQRSRIVGARVSEYDAWHNPYTVTPVTFEQGGLLGVGVQINGPGSRLVSLIGRVERSSGYYSASSFDNYVWRYHLLLGINLTK